MGRTSKSSQRLTSGMLALVASIFFVNARVPVLAQTPDSIRTKDLEAAIKLLHEQRSREAGAILTRLVNERRDDAELLYYLGIAYVQLKELKKATTTFESAIRLRPGFADAHAGLAYSLLFRGKVGEASVAAGEALSIQPNNGDAHYTLGIIAFRFGDRDRAIQHADSAIQAKPKLAEAYLLKSQALVSFVGSAILQPNQSANISRSNRYRAAAEALEQYLKLAPPSADLTVWQEQLDSLHFYTSAAPQEKIYSGKQVTTKVRLISKPEPTYTNEAREANLSGTVILRAVFAGDGKVKNILIMQALPNGLTEAAVQAARRIRFVPATLDGKPVSMWMQLEYHFNI